MMRLLVTSRLQVFITNCVRGLESALACLGYLLYDHLESLRSTLLLLSGALNFLIIDRQVSTHVGWNALVRVAWSRMLGTLFKSRRLITYLRNTLVVKLKLHDIELVLWRDIQVVSRSSDSNFSSN